MLEDIRIKIASAIAGTGVKILGGNSEAPPRRGTRELLQVYNASPWLRAVVHKIGVGVANTQWRLYVDRDSSNKAVRNRFLQYAGPDVRRQRIKELADRERLTEITHHPLLDLLSVGNTELLGIGVFQITQVHIDLVGEGFWVKERDGLGVPIALWPIPPNWIRALPTRDEPVFKISGTPSGEVAEIPATEVIYFRDPDPTNPYGRGSGTGKSLGDEIEIDEYAAKHLKAFFFNRARPDVIISGDNLSQEDTVRLEERWNQKQRGIWNAWKPAFLSRKVDVKPLTQSFENMQMSELRKQERDAFINVFGVPPEKLGIVNESKRSTINAADYFWTKDIIAPRAERLRTFLQWKLVPDFDDKLILDFETPIVQDEEFQLEVWKAAPFAYSIDEWRKFGSMKPIAGGDKHVVELNTAVIDITDPPDPHAEDAASSDGDDNDDNDDKSVDVTARLTEDVVEALPEITKQVVQQLRKKRRR